MIMRRIVLLMVLFFITCSIPVMAQAYYFYDTSGKKTTLTLNENKVVVSIPKEYEETNKRIRANVEVLFTIPLQKFDVLFITHSDFEKLTAFDFWEEDAKSVIITPSFFMWDDRLEKYNEVFMTPYVLVNLKKEEDIDILNSYIEKYKLIISDHRPSMPLSYILALSLESPLSPLEIANEMFESGNFAFSCPDIAEMGYGNLDPNTIRSITSTTIEESSEIYDLRGRKLSSKPTNGIYIHKGHKKLARSMGRGTVL